MYPNLNSMNNQDYLTTYSTRQQVTNAAMELSPRDFALAVCGGLIVIHNLHDLSIEQDTLLTEAMHAMGSLLKAFPKYK